MTRRHRCRRCGQLLHRFTESGLPWYVDGEPIDPADFPSHDRFDLWEYQGASWGWAYAPLRARHFPIYLVHRCPVLPTPTLLETPMTTPPQSLFAAAEKVPSLSFKGMPFGTKYTGKVLVAPSITQSIDFESGERATWPDGNPKMAIVIILEVAGEKRSLWASKPSALYAACGAAEAQAGAPIDVGGTLTVEYTHDVPNAKNPRLNPAKQYRVTYTPPGGAQGSAFGTHASAPAGQPVNGATYPDQPPF